MLSSWEIQLTSGFGYVELHSRNRSPGVSAYSALVAGCDLGWLGLCVSESVGGLVCTGSPSTHSPSPNVTLVR